MAHHMLEKMVEDKKDIEVYSCGIYADSGEPSTYNAIEIMKEYGIDMKNHRASNIKYVSRFSRKSIYNKRICGYRQRRTKHGYKRPMGM